MKKCIILAFMLILGTNSLFAGDAKLCVVGGDQSFWTGMDYNFIGNNFNYAADGTAGSAYYGWSVGTGCNGSASGAVTALCSTPIISGIAGCHTSGAGDATLGASGTGRYCYCKRTHVNGNPSLGVWAFMYAMGDAPGCVNQCANACAALVRQDAASRATLLAPVLP